MRNFLQADITNESSGLIIHGVNCKGVMGAGVAKSIRNKFPIVYDTYMTQPMVADSLGTIQYVQITDSLVIANCFTQVSYGNDGVKYADLDTIKRIIPEIFKYACTNNLSVKTVKIGCGLGGLSWECDVATIFDEAERAFPNVKIYYFEL